jgi:hypothetical protein
MTRQTPRLAGVFVYGWHSKSEEIMPCRFRTGQRGNGKPEPNPALLTVREREREREREIVFVVHGAQTTCGFEGPRTG